VEDIGGEGRALWRMIIYHILGIIVVPPLDQVLLASQPWVARETGVHRPYTKAGSHPCGMLCALCIF
jgi:hypothetical protein